MRTSDYLAFFEELGFDVYRQEALEDKEARESMTDGFMVHERFRGYSADDLCVTGLKVAFKVGEKEGDMITVAVIVDSGL